MKKQRVIKKRKSPPKKGIILKETKRSEDALAQIRNLCAEFFDHAVIIVSKEINGQTEFMQAFLGNQFAIKGMIETFLEQFGETEIEEIDLDDFK
jgi:hypothetical protein